MCGIAGFTVPAPGAHAVLAAMNAALGHRGPDASGVHVDDRIALGHTRLAIIDRTGGGQPRVDPLTGDALVFNGEIYGYRALAADLGRAGVALRDRSDTEILFQLIRRDGIRRALDRIDGMFAFAYRDGASGTLYLVRDRFGEKPLYYGRTPHGLVFASEAPALFCHPAFADAELDRQAAYRFLLFEYLPGTASGWERIAKLEPGTMLTATRRGVTIERYWRPPLPDRTFRPSEGEAVERLDALLSTSVRDRLVADVPLGIFLSGGLDSGLIAALAAGAAADLTALSVRIGGERFDETPHATEIARRLGLRHQIVDLDNRDLGAAFDGLNEKLGEPLADSSLLPSWLVCRAARRSMTVALGGDGADELFLGYPNFTAQRFAAAMRLFPGALARSVDGLTALLPGSEGYMNRRFLAAQLVQGFGADTARQSFLWMAPFGPARMASLWQPQAIPPDALDAAFAPIDERAAEAGHLGAVERLAYQFLTTYLPEDILAKTDRASMFNSLEMRAPFLGREFAEYACALPLAFKRRRGVGKYILKRLAGRYLPEAIVHRKKHGFAVPIGGLIRTLFRDRCRDVLLSAANPVAPWFRREAIEALWREHDSDRVDHGKKLWALYVLFTVAGRRRDRLARAA